MEILSHRGLWKINSEANTFSSVKKSIDRHFGFELDIRSFNNDLIVSHDPLVQSHNAFYFREILAYYQKVNSSVTIAINIKEDGLNLMVKSSLENFNISKYFVFDMSVPDTIHYLNSGIRYFTRQSEYETSPALYDGADGMWLDEFKKHWITNEILISHLDNHKKVCIVSPELHQREFNLEWEQYRKLSLLNKKAKNIMLCTDYASEAEEFFNGHKQ